MDVIRKRRPGALPERLGVVILREGSGRLGERLLRFWTFERDVASFLDVRMAEPMLLIWKFRRLRFLLETYTADLLI